MYEYNDHDNMWQSHLYYACTYDCKPLHSAARLLLYTLYISAIKYICLIILNFLLMRNTLLSFILMNVFFKTLKAKYMYYYLKVHL